MHIKPASEISEFELSKFSSLVNVLLENTLELEIVEEMTARIAQVCAALWRVSSWVAWTICTPVRRFLLAKETVAGMPALGAQSLP